MYIIDMQKANDNISTNQKVFNVTTFDCNIISETMIEVCSTFSCATY